MSASAREPARRIAAEAIAPREYLQLRGSPVFAGVGVSGAGLPVLLMPGFLSNDGAMSVMGRWLYRTGHRPYRARAGRNLGCAERAVRRLERRLDEIVQREGRPVALVGHSRGGHFARVLAVRRPDQVVGVVTLGAPPMQARAIHPAVAAPAIAVTLLGTFGIPGLMRASCFRGRCCARFRAELAGPFPREVRYVAVYSKADAVVDWQQSTDLAPERVEVPASHLGLVVNRYVYTVLASVLADVGERDE